MQWLEWKSGLAQREKVDNRGKKEAISVHVTTKEVVQGTTTQLFQDIEAELNLRVSRHVFNIRHQYHQLKVLREGLTQNEAIIHIDFSETMAVPTSYAQEVQSMDFGASHRQATLHTGVLYTSHSQTCESFCSISESLRHDPIAIWSHLDPVLKYVKDAYPCIDTLHFISDGPMSQYRSRTNFFLLSSHPFTLGLKSISWNFLEAGHGKGAPDGIGGALKRKADRLVAFGKDIIDAQTLFNVLTLDGSTVKLYFVSENDIASLDSAVPDKLQTVPGTMKLHQLFTATPYKIECRDLSCFCEKPRFCACHEPFVVRFQEVTDTIVADVTVHKPVNWEASTDVACTVVADCSTLQPVTHPVDELVGKHCVVNYENRPYPGVVLEVDETSLLVKAMHRIGRNRFFWPTMDDIIWYNLDKIVTIIPEPRPVTKRHLQVDTSLWKVICHQMDADDD